MYWRVCEVWIAAAYHYVFDAVKMDMVGIAMYYLLSSKQGSDG